MRKSVIALWVLAPCLLWLSLYRPFHASGSRAASLPSASAGFTLATEHELTKRTQELLGTSDAVWRTYRDSVGHEVYLVAVFHEQNWKSLHPPRICIEGSNMTVVAEDSLPADLSSGRHREIAILRAKSKETGRGYLSCYLYGTGDFTTGSYARFFMHHAPAALLRRNTSGFLLRVEAWTGSDSAGDLQRCESFLSAMVEKAQELVR